tara:strand:- start:96 stop:497 length:402 start_codon:yes stop_codon:yes gene_type:complete
MQSKYYIPDMSEFHPGFVFDLKRNEEQNWGINHIYGDTSPRFSKMRCYLHEYGCRVKYLDQADIESFGFTPEHNCELKWWVSGEWHLMDNGNSEIFIRRHNTNFNILPGIFEGTIKNKSELKKVLNQIGYEQK